MANAHQFPLSSLPQFHFPLNSTSNLSLSLCAPKSRMSNPKTCHHSSSTRSRRRRLCFFSVATILALALLLLILGLTVFRPKQAITTVNSVKLAGLKAGFDVTNLGVDLNVTLLLDLNVTNPNKASFKYADGSAQLYYRGTLVGEASIPPDNIGAGDTIETVVKLTILANRLMSDSGVYADVISGTLIMKTTTRIPGRVTILGLVKLHMVMYTTCDVTISIGSKSVSNSNCKSRTKL